jgi:hypothetical protein
MSRIARIIRNFSLIALAAFIFPMSAFASPAANLTAPETVTIQVDTTAPTSQVIFHGTINGKPADATAEATEDWTSNSNDKIHVTKITSWHASVGQPKTLDIELSQAGPGLITINGIPMAINGSIVPPGGGDRMYMVTNPGSGEQNVGLLPQTGEASFLSDPNMVATLVMALGAGILIFGLSLGKRAGRRTPAPRRLR